MGGKADAAKAIGQGALNLLYHWGLPVGFYGGQGYLFDKWSHGGKGYIDRWQNDELKPGDTESFLLNMAGSGAGFAAHKAFKHPGVAIGVGEGITGGTLALKTLAASSLINAESTAELNANQAKYVEQQRQTEEARTNTVREQAALARQQAQANAEIAKMQEATAREQANANMQVAQMQASAAKALPWVAGTIGAGGLLLAGLGIGKYLMSKPPKPKGTIRLKMPGKKGDPESTAEVELPLNMPKMSPSLVEGLDRAVRLRTRKNIRANSYKKDPETGKLIPYEDWEEKYGKNGEKLKNPSTDTPFASMIKDEAGLAKVSTAVEFSEGLGTATNAVALYHLGKILGPLLSRATHGAVAGSAADMTGGILAALLPTIGGHVAGKLMPARTAAEQANYDSQNNGILNHAIPGYAMYQASRRSKSKATNSSGARSDDSDDYGDDDDDWDKEASAVPQQQPQQPQDPNQQQPAQPAVDYSLFRGQYVPGDINRPAAKIQQNSNMQTAANNMQALKSKLNIV